VKKTTGARNFLSKLLPMGKKEKLTPAIPQPKLDKSNSLLDGALPERSGSFTGPKKNASLAAPSIIPCLAGEPTKNASLAAGKKAKQEKDIAPTYGTSIKFGYERNNSCSSFNSSMNSSISSTHSANRISSKISKLV